MLLVALSAVAAVVVIGVGPGARPDTIPFETVKALLQLGVVSAGVAGLTLLAYLYQRHREQEELRRELVRSMLRRATANYSAVKLARRLLRVRGVARTGVRRSVPSYSDKWIPKAAYDDQMNHLDEAQLEFENMKDEMEASKGRYKRNADEIIKLFGCLEEYLGNLVTEWEDKDNKHRPEGRPPSLRVGDLCRLDDLITPDRERPFFTKFSPQFHELCKLLLKNID